MILFVVKSLSIKKRGSEAALCLSVPWVSNFSIKSDFLNFFEDDDEQ